MSDTDVREIDLDGVPCIAWGCRVLLRDVLLAVGYNPSGMRSQHPRWTYLEHTHPPALAAYSARKGTTSGRPLSGMRWVTAGDIMRRAREAAQDARSGRKGERLDFAARMVWAAVGGMNDPLSSISYPDAPLADCAPIEAALDPLTKQQRKVMMHIVSHMQEHQCCPTYREIAAFVGSKSAQAGAHYVAALISKGYLARARARAFKVLRDPQGHPVKMTLQRIEEGDTNE